MARSPAVAVVAALVEVIVAWDGGTISCGDAPVFNTGAPNITVDNPNSSYKDWYIQHLMYWDGYNWQWGGWSHWHNKVRNANAYYSNWVDITTGEETAGDTWGGAAGYAYYAVYTWIWDGERGQYLTRYFAQEWYWSGVTGREFCQESPENRVFG